MVILVSYLGIVGSLWIGNLNNLQVLKHGVCP